MKNLHFLVGLVALFGASAMAQGVKSSNDPMGDLISFVTKGKEIRSAKARAMTSSSNAETGSFSGRVPILGPTEEDV